MTKTQPQFVVGSRVFSHYTRDRSRGISGWGTVEGINTTYRDQKHGVTGDPLPDTTWYDVRADEGHTELLDDAHGNWDMARLIPPHIAKKYGYGDDPAEKLREPFTVMVNGVDLRVALIHALIEECGYGNHVGREDPANFADNFMRNFGKESMWGNWDEPRDNCTEAYDAYAKSVGLIRH